MTIQVGDKVPSVNFKHMTADGPADISSDEVFSGKKVVFFAVPGAFTPGCSLTHLPGFVVSADALKAKFRDYAKAIAETKGTMADDTKDAFFSLTQAEYAAGDFKKAVLEGNMVAQVRVTSAVDNVAGVKLPVFNLQETGAVNDNQTLGLVGGGKKVSWLNLFLVLACFIT